MKCPICNRSVNQPGIIACEVCADEISKSGAAAAVPSSESDYRIQFMSTKGFLEVVSHWIPVSERLPEVGRFVLVINYGYQPVTEHQPPPDGLVLVNNDPSPLPTIAYLEADSRRFCDPDYGWVKATHWCEVRMPDGKSLPLQQDL